MRSPRTCFNTPFGRYDRLPYGLCSAPEVFHKYMEVMFGDIEGSRVYMDDILVWGSTEEEHDRRLQEVKDRIEKYNLPMNWSKCEIKKSEIRFIGDKMSCKGISPAGDKVEAAILQMQKPQCKEDVQRALGCINYVGKFIPNLANKCTHIRSLKLSGYGVLNMIMSGKA